MENNEKAYYEKVDIDNELKLRKQLAALPPYCKQYFIAIESKTQSRTRLAYAYDLSCFFDYLHENKNRPDTRANDNANITLRRFL